MPTSKTFEPQGQLRLVCDAISIQAAADEDQQQRPRFSMVAYTGGVMSVYGWGPIVIDLEGLKVPSQSRPIRFAHDSRAGVGHTEEIRVDKGRLVASGVISRDTEAAREIIASARNGFPWQASVGVSVDEHETLDAQAMATINGRKVEGPVTIIRRGTLGEISFVDLGADDKTRVRVAAGAPNDEDEDMDEPTTTNPTTTETDGQHDAPAQAEAPADQPKEHAGDISAEAERILAIRRICAGNHPEIEAEAVRDHWDVSRCALAVLRATRPQAPAVHVTQSQPVNGRLLEAACMLTAGANGVEQMFDEQTLDSATRRFRGGIGLQELLLEAAWANGYTGRSFRDSRSVLRFAFRPELEAGFSTVNIGGILSNVANKFLLDGFYSVERTWRNITATRNVSDFKAVESYRLVGKDQYEQVAPTGELKHGTLGEETYSNRADTYGLVLTIDRRDIINDDLGAITGVPRKLGRGSGLKINDVFWKTFLDNSTFFASGNNNYITGDTTALSIDGLTQGEVAFMDQVDSDGKPIGVMPAILLVPTALSAVGSQLFKSMELRDTTSTKYPVANPHQGKFRVEVSRYLSNSAYTGYSSKAWYLLADPNDLPVIEVAFLNGQESPTIETADADFSVLGIQMRGYHDFGVALQDYRGGLKAKGEA